MQRIELYQIDAFTDKVFHGNPAAICLLTDWFNDELLLAIAQENNLSETAFVIEDSNDFQLRWFTPKGEISLCGHATLAAAFLLFELGKCKKDTLHFHSLGGRLAVTKKGDRYTMDFPRLNYYDMGSAFGLSDIIDQPIIEAYESDLDYLVLLGHETHVAQATVDTKYLSKLAKRGLIITARASNADFYSRCFYPKHNIIEDAVTGSAHCVLAPFWSKKLDKTSLHGIQGLHRKGDVFCDVLYDRVHISGYCRWYLKGYLLL